MAAPGQAQPPNMNLFDSYFTRADLDRDGRISGQEAVAFFQGSNLPKPVLAQIWTYADQNQTGFLGRPEFYNCLKLVTVAQSGRQLTPDMVKAALYGPAAAKIPPPQINLVPSSGGAQTNSLPTSTSQLNPMMRPSGQMGVAALSSSQNIGFRGPQPTANLGTNQQFLTSTPLASVPLQGVNQGFSGAGGVVDPRLSSSNTPKLVTDWHTPRTSGASVGAISQGSVRGSALPANQDGFGLAVPGIAPGIPPKLQNQPPLASSGPPNPVSPQSQPAVNNFKSLAFSGNSFSNSVSEGNAFTSTYQTKSDVSGPSFSGNISTDLSSGSASVTAVSHNSNMMSQLDSLYGSSVPPQAGGYHQPAQSLTKQNKVDAVPSTSAAANVLVGPASSTGQPQLNWPKITQSDIQKYTRVFVEVDKDRDGKITGEQARSLFISWRLPREVLKQIWDLSDQDNDSMLSLREFCTALYLMERYREGRPLPDVLPNTLKYDETLLRSTTQPSNAYSGQAFQPNSGLSHQGIPGARPPLPGVRPPLQTSFPLHTDGMGQHVQQNSRIPGLDKHMVNQFGKEQSASGIQFQEATNADKKKLEEEILDSKEKIEFYRTMMQELVLYKSRCDNRLNEITERASADKREAESLGKKYEEKYKQVGELASKLTVEEATHRDVQERKMELQSAITKMDQGGSADGLLQVRADRIQNHLEELMKALDDRCKHHGLHVKSTGIIELPFGWQPGIPDVAVDWDEDWDKFEDDGFVVAKDLTIDVDNAVATEKPKSPSTWSDKVSMDEFSPDSSSNFNIKNEKSSSTNARMTESESAYDQSEEDFARSPTGSAGRSALGSPSQEFHATEFGTRDNSPLGRESHRHHAESTISGDKFPDEPSWSFDGNDDADSVWDYNSILAKENDYDGSGPSSFFDSGDYGLKPIKVDSPSAISTFGKENKSSFFADSPSGVSTFGKDNKSSFFADSPSAASTFGKENKSSFFADSVPSTPLYNSGLSPKFNDGAEDNSYSSFGRFDSFSTKDEGFFPQRESFTRFDSMRSTADFDHKQGESFSRFDSMRSTAGFDNRQGESFARFDSMRSTTGFDNNRQGESFARFDSMRSTTGFDHNRGFPSFDDADPFGSTGPFKSSESHSPKRGSDNWSAF